MRCQGRRIYLQKAFQKYYTTRRQDFGLFIEAYPESQHHYCGVFLFGIILAKTNYTQYIRYSQYIKYDRLFLR